ncbi:farnesyl-diphosphate synthase [Tistlia consotensis]|uniref:Farnesyl-diphosphate synthase n=1 Tax=Tistlia consotensis USBA 355 TaxID=560819 RepID=A0A1Y6CFL5_9PROT|nr:farnesyl diphosphate synthase [Tistlia consotensis]SMF60722.1 farnesyl-diphosphate synthase [Tistlia consotensis USBA 355]SNR92916.1 farnesyl-diphosphate synthase [Tistlia consotensis]
MTEAELKKALAEVAGAVETMLAELMPDAAGPIGRLRAAMRHGSLNGGKRLRPFLLVGSADLFGVPRERSLRAGVALEMVHCYSLVHDDLPAMDDSDLRRGQPTVHKAYDDATAVLAGDALLTEAFGVLADPATHPDPAVRCRLVAGLARAAGSEGMVGGQAIDLSAERHGLDLAGIERLQALKTGALIAYACEAGALLGEASPEQTAALVDYARLLGLAFQIVDDLLDVEGTTEELGKPAQQDADLGKATFVVHLGVDGARRRAAELADKARCRLDSFGENADALRRTIDFVLARRS